MSLKAIQKKLFSPLVSIINIHGNINSEMTTHVEKSLKNVNTDLSRALAVSVNSRGGSPVQSQIISNKIRKFAKDNHFKVWMFAEDICASGGYYILATGDKVYADRTSIVGSIGVISDYSNGVQSREGTYNQVSILTQQLSNLLSNTFDPFVDISEQNKELVLEMGHNIHKDFINHVQRYRGGTIKLKGLQERRKQLYNGDIWQGVDAKELGLVDEVGSMVQVLGREFPDCKLSLAKGKDGLAKYLM